jgi:hypothetical protein
LATEVSNTRLCFPHTLFTQPGRFVNQSRRVALEPKQDKSKRNETPKSLAVANLESSFIRPGPVQGRARFSFFGVSSHFFSTHSNTFLTPIALLQSASGEVARPDPYSPNGPLQESTKPDRGHTPSPNQHRRKVSLSMENKKNRSRMQKKRHSRRSQTKGIRRFHSSIDAQSFLSRPMKKIKKGARPSPVPHHPVSHQGPSGAMLTAVVL